MSGLTLALFIQYSLNFLKPRMPYLRGIEVVPCIIFRVLSLAIGSVVSVAIPLKS